LFRPNYVSVEGKFEFEYDLLRHIAYCIVHKIVIEASKKFKSSKKY